MRKYSLNMNYINIIMNDSYKSEQKHISISMLKDDVEKKHINTTVVYQREDVWDKDHQRYYIDSLCKGIIPIPLIINHDEEENTKICIDGKQRIKAIMDFMSNKISVKQNGIDLYYDEMPLDDMENTAVMNKHDRSIFNEKTITYTLYRNLNFNDQTNLFHRINHGIQLNNCEMLISNIKHEDNAKQYKDMCMSINNIMRKQFDIKRMKHVQFVTSISASIKHNNHYPTSKQTKNIINDEELLAITKKGIDHIKKCFSEHILNNTAFRNKLKYPFIYHIIIMFLYHNKNKINIEENAETIRKSIIDMYKHIKENKKNVDIKSKHSDNIELIASIFAKILNNNLKLKKSNDSDNGSNDTLEDEPDDESSDDESSHSESSEKPIVKSQKNTKVNKHKK